MDHETLAGGPAAAVALPDWVIAALWINVAVFLIWAVLTLFIYLRRSASNLTPVNAATAKKGAKPDFLSVDERARRDQIKRGEAFERELDKREEAEARAAIQAAKKPMTILQRLAGIATFLVSLFSLASTAVGVILQTDRIGSSLSQADKLMLVAQKYPIPFTVCVFVILYYVATFFIKKQWKSSR